MLGLSLYGIELLSREFADLRKSPSTNGVRKAPVWVSRASSRVTARVPLLEAALARIDPTLSLHRILAEVVEVRDETHDVKTFVLRPNARFGAFRPGAYVTVRVTIGGRVHQRAYSLSSSPGAGGLVSITVKRVPGGLVSNHLADAVAPGHVLELGAPAGQFVLPNDAPTPRLMISAGSGITPVMSMLRHLVRSGSTAPLTFLHFARTPEDVIFAEELRAIAGESPNVNVVVCVETAGAEWSGPRGRFSLRVLEEAAPNFAAADTYLCGPSAFMRLVMQTLERGSADLSRLRFERFTAAFDAASFLEHSHTVRFLRSGVDALSNRPLTVLQEAESRGLKVETGCRAGTCGTCRCKKKKGIVFNTATGLESGVGEEMIYPCVSIARGSVEVEL